MLTSFALTACRCLFDPAAKSSQLILSQSQTAEARQGCLTWTRMTDTLICTMQKAEADTK